MFLQPDVEDNDDEVEEEVEQSPARWRPPTPPKASPKRSPLTSNESPAVLESEAQIPNLKIVTPTNLFSSVLDVQESHTPTPPQLLTVESSQLFKPIMPDMNTTFDLNSKDDGNIYSTKLIKNS